MVTKTFQLFLGLLLLCGTGTLLAFSSEGPIEWERDLFVNGTYGYHTFRIPSLIVTRQGSVIAFAEGRKNDQSDTGDIDLVMRRSTDGGETWGPLTVIWDDGDNVCGNPTAVVDLETGLIWLLLTWNRGDDHERDIIRGQSKDTRRVFITHSGDDGLTWATPTDVTAATKDPSWGWYATGPGMGVQLQHGPHRGRLVIPANHSYTDSDGKIAGGGFEYGAHSIFSDDHGKTWQMGGLIQPKMNESQLVELGGGSGTLLINMRSYYGKNRRAQALSDDGGLSWTDAVEAVDLVEPVCQAAIIRYPLKSAPNGEVLLFSNPASTKREQMEIKVSKDDGRSWKTWVRLYDGPAAYSALAVLPSGEVLCLYEKGVNNPYERIRLVKLSAVPE
ncbi:MAG: exo-alpha-sialidase [Lunatimonas sp.]|nr:exo-alpha-sialidase [Lunatimonas sp.]